jgi:hypothetical protein
VSDRLRRIVAWWQIICGLLGLGMFGAAYFGLLPNGRAWLEHTTGWINYYAGIGFFSLSIAAGRSLLRREAWGLWASCACQAVQVLSFAIRHGPQVQIAAGPAIGVKISSTQIGLSAGFQSTFFLGTLIEGPAFAVVVNVLALAWTVVLFREAARRRGAGRADRDVYEFRIDSIGS